MQSTLVTKMFCQTVGISPCTQLCSLKKCSHQKSRFALGTCICRQSLELLHIGDTRKMFGVALHLFLKWLNGLEGWLHISVKLCTLTILHHLDLTLHRATYTRLGHTLMSVRSPIPNNVITVDKFQQYFWRMKRYLPSFYYCTVPLTTNFKFGPSFCCVSDFILEQENSIFFVSSDVSARTPPKFNDIGPT